MEFLSPAWFSALAAIVVIDLVLAGDNAIVIALACRNLPPRLRRRGILWGTAGAIGIRAALIVFAVTLLTVPYLKLVGGVLLVWIGVKLLLPGGNGEEAHGNVQGGTTLWSAVKTVIIADLVMSIDNVIAIAGAAHQAGPDHQLGLVIFGLAVSVPLLVWGSTLVLKLIERYPVVVLLGGSLLGWIAGGMMISDPVVVRFIGEPGPALYHAAAVAGAGLVVVLGKMLGARRKPAGELD